MPVFLICGPPCSGKTTLAHHLARPGDEILDFDVICSEIDDRTGWDHAPRVRDRADQVMYLRIQQLSRMHITRVDHYVIRSSPNPASRENLAHTLRTAAWLLSPGQAECERRAHADRRPASTLVGIREWYRTYRPSRLDSVPPACGLAL